MEIVEVGFLLDKDLEYYDQMLKSNGFINNFNCTTYDLYFTNKKINDMSEKQIKDLCIRLRSVNQSSFKVENNLLKEVNFDVVQYKNLNNYSNKIGRYGFKRIFDTFKKDHHYYKEGMSSKIQLQEIDEIGLVLYYDNEEYYNYSEEEQRRLLIDELNSYGFNFNYNDLGIDKLRTLFYKKKMYSKNQNS